MSVTRADVVVVGLGSIGAMALWRTAAALAGTGKTVLGIEQYGPLHAAGSYTGESRLFRVAAKEGRFFTPALLRSRELWLQLQEESGRLLLREAGVLSLAPGDHPDIATTLAVIDEFGLDAEVFDAAQLRARFPQFAVESGDVGVLDPLGGGSRPEAAVLSGIEAAERLGAQVWSGTAVEAIEQVGDGVRIGTPRGDVIAERVIVTTGSWTTRLVPELADLVTVGSFGLTWLMPRHIEWFTPDRFPGFMRDLGDVHAFGAPTLDGFSIKICPHVILPEVGDYADRFTELTREQLAWIGEQAQRMIPDLVPDPVRWSVHPDSATAARVPIIDTMAGGAIAIATGMSGNGFKFAPVWGQALADLATTGRSDWQNPLFTIAAHRGTAS